MGTSRCPGCCGLAFFNKHPSCGFITCCVKKKNLEVYAECSDFPCSKFKTAEEYQVLETSSYPPYRKIIPNLNFIRDHGIKKFIEQQQRRITFEIIKRVGYFSILVIKQLYKYQNERRMMNRKFCEKPMKEILYRESRVAKALGDPAKYAIMQLMLIKNFE